MIILNTLNGAVSEHSLAPQSITPTHMGDALGLYLLGGELDDTQPIVSEVLTGETLWGSSLKKLLNTLYFSMAGAGTCEAIVKSRNAEYRYSFPVRSTGQSRALTGRGIRDNYLAFGFTNPGGEYFQLDQIEALTAQSATRRV